MLTVQEVKPTLCRTWWLLRVAVSVVEGRGVRQGFTAEVGSKLSLEE